MDRAFFVDTGPDLTEPDAKAYFDREQLCLYHVEDLHNVCAVFQKTLEFIALRDHKTRRQIAFIVPVDLFEDAVEGLLDLSPVFQVSRIYQISHYDTIDGFRIHRITFRPYCISKYAYCQSL